MQSPCPPLDCVKRWQPDHACRHHPNSMSLLNKKWSGKLRLACANALHPPSETRVGVISWTCRSQETRDTAGKQMIWRTFKLIHGFYDLETVCSLFKLNESSWSETTPFQGVQQDSCNTHSAKSLRDVYGSFSWKLDKEGGSFRMK